MKKPLLSLALMVKNEAHCIRATLESVRPFVDRWLVLDTGSSDGTQTIVRETLRDLPGHLFEEPFIDFAASRNRLLGLTSLGKELPTNDQYGVYTLPPTEWTLMLSADEVLDNGAALRAFLESQRNTGADIFCIQMRQKSSDLETAWMSPRIVRTGSPWQYEGKIHEQLVDRTGQRDCVLRTGEESDLRAPSRIVHSATDGARRASNAQHRDLPLLEEAIAQDPENSRLTILLAQTYEGMAANAAETGQGEVAASYAMRTVTLYQDGANCAKSKDEQNYARMKYLNCAEILRLMPEPELLAKIADLSKEDPDRPETAYMLAHHLAQTGRNKDAFESACAAASIAARANHLPGSIPHETTCEWRSHLLAAMIAVGAEGGAEMAHECAKACINAGGPLGVIESFPTPKEQS